MLVRDTGEFRLIDLLAETLAAEGTEGPRIGIGDDAAVWEGSPARESSPPTRWWRASTSISI